MTKRLVFPALAFLALAMAVMLSPSAATAADAEACNNKFCQQDPRGDWKNCVAQTNGPSTNCTGGGVSEDSCLAKICK